MRAVYENVYKLETIFETLMTFGEMPVTSRYCERVFNVEYRSTRSLKRDRLESFTFCQNTTTGGFINSSE